MRQRKRVRRQTVRAASIAASVALVATLVAGPATAAPRAKILPTLYLEVGPNIIDPEMFSAEGVLEGANNMGGTLTLWFFGKTDPTCAIPGDSSTGPVHGPTHRFGPSSYGGPSGGAGTYYWKVTYSGDSTHEAVSSACIPQNLAPSGSPRYAPFNGYPNLVRQQYRDLLGREPTSDELAFWVPRLNANAGTVAGDVVRVIRLSADHHNNVDPATRLYRAYFLRIPDPGGLKYWIAQKRGGRGLSAVSSAFAASSEFKNTYGALTNRQFVDLIYRNILHRAGDPGGTAFWTQQLDSGRRSRGQVMIGFSESNEYRIAEANEVDLSVLTILLLGRAPRFDEFQYRVGELDAGRMTGLDLASDLLRRPEYAQRFVT